MMPTHDRNIMVDTLPLTSSAGKYLIDPKMSLVRFAEQAGTDYEGRAGISIRHDGDGQFSVQLSGKTQFDTTFDIAFSAPLTISLIAYRNTANADELLSWFDGFPKKNDFTFTPLQRGEGLYLNGVVK